MAYALIWAICIVIVTCVLEVLHLMFGSGKDKYKVAWQGLGKVLALCWLLPLRLWYIGGCDGSLLCRIHRKLY